MVLTNEQYNRLIGIVEHLSDKTLADEWSALVAMQEVYLDKKASDRILVDIFNEVYERVTLACVERFISTATANASEAQTAEQTSARG